MRVISHNIEKNPPEFEAGDMAAVAAVLAPYNADVIGVQELAEESWLTALGAELNMNTKFGASGGSFDNGILYRGTLLDSAVYTYTNVATGDNRGLVRAKTSYRGNTFWAISTHLGLGEQGNPATAEGSIARVAQVAELKAVVDTLVGPVFLLGDFNAQTGSQAREDLDGMYINAADVSPPASESSDFDDRVIVYYRGNLTTRHTRNEDAATSDHPVIMADVGSYGIPRGNAKSGLARITKG